MAKAVGWTNIEIACDSGTHHSSHSSVRSVGLDDTTSDLSPISLTPKGASRDRRDESRMRDDCKSDAREYHLRSRYKGRPSTSDLPATRLIPSFTHSLTSFLRLDGDEEWVNETYILREFSLKISTFIYFYIGIFIEFPHYHQLLLSFHIWITWVLVIQTANNWW